MKKAEIRKIYDILGSHVRIYNPKLMKVGEITGWGYLRIMNILERELKIKKHTRRRVR